MARLCGASLGLFAFSVTILLGVLAGNPSDTTILRALWSMFVFCVIGLLVGWVSSRVLDEHALRRHRELFGDEKEEPDAATGPEGSVMVVDGTATISTPGA